MPTTQRQNIRGELEQVREGLVGDRPELAHRLARVVQQLERDQAPHPGSYLSSGEAALRLGVSPNTVKKWVRTGVIVEFWVMPGSGYVKIAASEVERLRQGEAS